MKRKITLLALAACSVFTMSSQVTLYESFTAPFNPVASGWDVQNLSSTTGTNTSGWRQGNANSYLTALKGNPDDYFSVDKYATSLTGATNTISCWLITPTVNLTNGGILQFSIKSFTANPGRPERLQIYYSFGTGNNVGSSAGSATNTAGTFTTLIADINPNMTSTFANLWSWANTYSLTGITTPGVGRIAFRYYIENGGDAAPNGNYIGLDEVRYQMPCARPNFFGDVTNTPTVCTGTSTQLKIYPAGSNAPTTYTWFNGATTSLTAYTFTQAGVREICSLGQNATGCQHLDVSYIFVQASPTVAVAFNPNGVICSGNTVAVTSSGANTYTYFLGTNSYTSNPITLSAPQVNTLSSTQFTVVGTATNGCLGGQYVTLNINPNPTITAIASRSTICVKQTVTLTANGAATYSWTGASASTLTAFTYTAGSTAGAQQFTVYGVSQAGCKSANVVTTVSVSNCTGFENTLSTSLQPSIYPNPFKDELNFQNFEGSVSIYNISGQLVAYTTTQESRMLITSSFSPGIYLVKATSTLGEVYNFKLIKD
ncbi:hypothetical protein CNR22_04525 [Sphingobacteriaceae bacterium]|nr:hypothetical protein CNR22_04525 [Sphingobacteriaceae bacterium]